MSPYIETKFQIWLEIDPKKKGRHYSLTKQCKLCKTDS